MRDRLAAALSAIEALDPGDVFDPAVPAAVAATGLHAVAIPVADGGSGAGLLDIVKILSAIGAVDGATALGLGMHLHVIGAAAQSDVWSPPLRERLFRAVADEGALVNAAATEVGGGSPARGAIPGTLATWGAPTESGSDETAGDQDPTRKGAGAWRLTGEKTWTTWLPALRFALVSARMGESDDPTEVGLFLVDLESPGVERRPGFEALGMRGSASGRLRLTDVRVEDACLLLRRSNTRPDPRGATPGAWFGIAMAATYLGVGEGARDAVARWARDRRPGGGESSVADVPTIQLRLGRMDAALRAARIVVEDVARRWDATSDERPDLMDGARSALRSDLTLAKLTATNAAVLATEEGLRISGGPGYLSGRLERAFRDARAGLINPPLDDIVLTGFGRDVVARQP